MKGYLNILSATDLLFNLEPSLSSWDDCRILYIFFTKHVQTIIFYLLSGIFPEINYHFHRFSVIAAIVHRRFFKVLTYPTNSGMVVVVTVVGPCLDAGLHFCFPHH